MIHELTHGGQSVSGLSQRRNALSTVVGVLVSLTLRFVFQYRSLNLSSCHSVNSPAIPRSRMLLYSMLGQRFLIVILFPRGKFICSDVMSVIATGPVIPEGGWGWGGGGGVPLTDLAAGVPHPILLIDPDPISDQNIPFSRIVFRPGFLQPFILFK